MKWLLAYRLFESNKTSEDFNMDYIRAYIALKQCRPTRDNYSNDYTKYSSILNDYAKTIRYLPNGLWTVTQKIDTTLSNIRSLSFDVGYLLYFNKDEIKYSYDNGITWKNSYKFDLIKEKEKVARNQIDTLYYTFYKSLKNVYDYNTWHNIKTNAPEIYAELSQRFGSLDSLDNASKMGEMGF